jgi:hypothetical protein
VNAFVEMLLAWWFGRPTGRDDLANVTPYLGT